MEKSLAEAYDRCRRLHRQHGRTYYLATKLLPAEKRPHVHALYGFTRYADEIVDGLGPVPTHERAAQLRAWSERFLAGLGGGAVDDPILPAVIHTVTTLDLDRADFASFLASMAMDLERKSYVDYEDLLTYMEGSAAVIGTMMLPILGPSDRVGAREPARQLGIAFQLTNFIRDVGEDLERDRVYLPEEDLREFGVTRTDLKAAAAAGTVTPRIRALLTFEVTRARSHYAAAAPGIPMLEPNSQACIRTAYHLYGGILDEVERANYDVFRRRAVVPRWRRLQVAIRCLRTPAGEPVSTARV